MYVLIAGEPNLVFRTTDNAFIPNDPLNRDWIAYQVWLAAGNQPE